MSPESCILKSRIKPNSQWRNIICIVFKRRKRKHKNYHYFCFLVSNGMNEGLSRFCVSRKRKPWGEKRKLNRIFVQEQEEYQLLGQFPTNSMMIILILCI